MVGIEQTKEYKDGFRDGQIDGLFKESSLKDGETYQAEYLEGYLDGWNRQKRVAEGYRKVSL